jgi:Cation efflux family
MADAQDGGHASAPGRDDGGAETTRDLLGVVPDPSEGRSESVVTVLVAFAANTLIAVAKTAAAVVTGSASLVAEAAHSWADSGNQVFLMIANRRAGRPSDSAHPLGHGREAYVWSLFAALGVFLAGAAVSITHGVQELITPQPASNFVVGYVVLAVSFVLEGTSFLRSMRQAKPEAASLHRDLIEHVLATSDPTLRAVFAEDSAALIGLCHRRCRTGPAPGDRFADPGRRWIDPGRPGAGRGGSCTDQLQSAVPDRGRGRSTGASGRPSGVAGRAGGRQGDLFASGIRRPANGVGRGGCRPHRRRYRVAFSRPAAGARGEDQCFTRSGRGAAEPICTGRADVGQVRTTGWRSSTVMNRSGRR